MTPQSNFMVLAPIDLARRAELEKLLESMNEGPGRVKSHNEIVPFAEFDTLHFARFVILDDQTIEDVREHGMPVTTYPLYLAFLGDIDGEANVFLKNLARRAGKGLRQIFSCCTGFTAETDLLSWMVKHSAPALANYVNTRGRTVRQVHEEATLRDAIESYLAANSGSLQALPAPDVYMAVRKFVREETAAGRLTLSSDLPTPLGWWIRNMTHKAGLFLLFLVLLPFLILTAPIYLVILRILERTDPEICFTVDQAYSEKLSESEDHLVTNQFSAMGSLKPGLFRLLTTIGVLTTVNYGARHLVRPGRLGRIRSIHFARWAFIAGTRRMAFFSNYDGSVESYMDDFINKTGFGLNASFSNGIGYPRTRFLLLDGCADERKYKEFLRRHTLPTQVWYKAYPGLTAIDMERNSLIRRGLESASMSDEKAAEWVALL